MCTLLWFDEKAAQINNVSYYPSPLMTWTNLMPLQYLKTTTAALYYRQVALLSKRKKKNSGKLQEWKKRQTRKKKLMNFDDSANDELEFEKWMFWFLVCRIFPHAKKQALYWCRNWFLFSSQNAVNRRTVTVYLSRIWQFFLKVAESQKVFSI